MRVSNRTRKNGGRHLVMAASVVAGFAAVAGGSALVGLTSPVDAWAQVPGKAGKKKGEPEVDVAALKAKVESKTPATVAAGLAEIQSAGSAAKGVAPAVEKLLVVGTTKDLAQKAMTALAAIGEPSSSKVLEPYLRHRDDGLRREAVKALAETGGPDAIRAFQSGLRSSDGMVRGFSATGLGALGAKGALADLFLALDHNVVEAASAIGQLCAPQECAEFATRLNRLPLEVMTSGFDPILFRAEPLPERDQLNLIGAIRELGTKEAGQYLVDVQSRWPDHYSEKVKQAIDSAITSIPGATDGGDK
jgi:HEAT repeat protein